MCGSRVLLYLHCSFFHTIVFHFLIRVLHLSSSYRLKRCFCLGWWVLKPTFENSVLSCVHNMLLCVFLGTCYMPLLSILKILDLPVFIFRTTQMFCMWQVLTVLHPGFILSILCLSWFMLLPSMIWGSEVLVYVSQEALACESISYLHSCLKLYFSDWFYFL